MRRPGRNGFQHRNNREELRQTGLSMEARLPEKKSLYTVGTNNYFQKAHFFSLFPLFRYSKQSKGQNDLDFYPERFGSSSRNFMIDPYSK